MHMHTHMHIHTRGLPRNLSSLRRVISPALLREELSARRKALRHAMARSAGMSRGLAAGRGGFLVEPIAARRRHHFPLRRGFRPSSPKGRRLETRGEKKGKKRKKFPTVAGRRVTTFTHDTPRVCVRSRGCIMGDTKPTDDPLSLSWSCGQEQQACCCSRDCREGPHGLGSPRNTRRHRGPGACDGSTAQNTNEEAKRRTRTKAWKRETRNKAKKKKAKSKLTLDFDRTPPSLSTQMYSAMMEPFCGNRRNFCKFSVYVMNDGS